MAIRQKWAIYLALCLLLVGALSAPLGAAAADAWFTPHRGIYRMSLISAESSSGIIGASGEMYFEWTDTCDGWNVNQHTSLYLASSQEKSNQTTISISGTPTPYMEGLLREIRRKRASSLGSTIRELKTLWRRKCTTENSS